MEKIIVRGGRKLQGEVDISVAKNSVLPIIVATILNPTEIILPTLIVTTLSFIVAIITAIILRKIWRKYD